MQNQHMQNQRFSFVLAGLFLCAMMLLFGNASLFAQGGILIDARGTVARNATQDLGRLSDSQIRAAKASYTLSGDVSVQSPMRCVSLNRLEKSIIESNGIMTEEMKYLAGLQRITHVFYFPESKDIVIAGPAEGWFPGFEGAMIGNESLLPVCELQHLVTALRIFRPGTADGMSGRGESDRGESGSGESADRGFVTCSIDPTEEGLARLQQFQNQQFQNRSAGLTRQRFVDGVRQAIGMQTVRVEGIPDTTHAAQMMVAADYRMKRIGLGLDTLRVPGLQTFIAHTVPGDSNMLYRWYFVPDYDSVILTADRSGMHIVGDGVKLVAENELAAPTGERTAIGGSLDPGSAAFTRSFTEHYPQIARQALVFAQLRNWIDMLICAAHIHREDFYTQSGWAMEFFGDETKFSLETFVAAREVEPVVGIRNLNRRLALTPVGGGIEIDAELALSDQHVRPDEDGKVAERKKQLALNLPNGVWWWDVP